MRIGFVGLGIMGGSMALNVRKAGFELVVHDLRKDLAQRHLDAGATWAGSLAELARGVDVVLTSLPGPREMEAVGLGEGGLLLAMERGTAWFDLTTNSPTVVRRVAARFAERGIDVLDCPVSGGAVGARTGKLALYVGGDAEVLERFRKVLDAVGDKVVHVGGTGAGAIAKLAHNCASYVGRLAIAEVFAMGVKAGVEPLALWHAIRMGHAGRRRTFDGIEMFLEDRYDPPSFALNLTHKDMVLATELGRELNVPMRLAELTRDDLAEALDRDWGGLDGRASMKLQLERSGVAFAESAEAVRQTEAKG